MKHVDKSLFFKTLGGLCNRMRSIDSALVISEKYNMNLTVLWAMDHTLNCSFYELFEPFKKRNVRVINTPPQFPEAFDGNLYSLSEGSLQNKPNGAKFFIKSFLRKTSLDSELRNILNQLNTMNTGQILTDNLVFRDQFASKTHINNLNTKEMEKLFIEKIGSQLQLFLKSTVTPQYISTCYRLTPLRDNYANFKPIKPIQEKVDATVSKFNKTIGLHIRRTDHSTSVAHSGLDLFVQVIERHLATDSNMNIFLCTDDSDTKKNLMDKYGDKIITNEVSTYDRNNPAAVMDALVDLLCLSKTATVYGSHHSSFSQTAADLGMVPEVTVKS